MTEESRELKEKSKTLYEIVSSVLELNSSLEELEGDITGQEEFIDKWFNDNESELRNKLDSYAALIRENEARAISLRSEAQRMLDLATSHSNMAQSLRKRATFNLNRIGVNKIETEHFQIRVASNGGMLPIKLKVDELELPNDYIEMRPMADMKAIRNDLEHYLERLNKWCKEHPGMTEDDAAEHIAAPEALKYASIEPRGQHLRIK